MRFLHTADWHVGKTLRGRSRLDEQERVLAEILDIARREQVHCLLVSGDIFDSYAPSAEAERIVFQFLAEVIGQEMKAVLIAGNHDHPKRLEALARLVEPLGIFIRTRPHGDSRESVIEVPNGSYSARIVALPFVSHSSLVRATHLFEGTGEDVKTYEEAVRAILGKSSYQPSPDSVNLLVGHLHISEARTSGSERSMHLGAPYEVSPHHLPTGLHYVALGHLHQPQDVSAPSPTRYAGSTLQLDFGEQGQEKRVVVVDATPGLPAECRSVSLRTGRPVFQLEGTLPELRDLRDSVGDAFLKITLEAPRYEPGQVQEVRELFPDAVEVRLAAASPQECVQERRIGRLSPQDMYREFYKNRQRPKPPRRLLKRFHELYEEATVETG